MGFFQEMHSPWKAYNCDFQMIDHKKLQRAFKHTFDRINAIEQQLEILEQQNELWRNKYMEIKKELEAKKETDRLAIMRWN